MEPKAIESMEDRGGAPSKVLPYQRWLAWRPVLGDTVPPGLADDRPEVSAVGGAALGVSSSGRMATTLEFRADRWDDGLLVGPSGPEAGGKRMVWVADLVLVPLAVDPALEHSISWPGAPRDGASRRLPHGASNTRSLRFHAPTVSVGTETDVRVDWPQLPAGEYALRFTVLCRPDNDVTFENEGFDSSVSVSALGTSTRVVIQPYPTLAPVEIEVCTAAELRVDPAWQKGVDVIGWDGTRHVEDRFSPGELRFRWDDTQRPLSVTARVLESANSDSASSAAVEPLDAAPVSPPARYLAPDWLAAAEPSQGAEPRGGAGSSERLAHLLWRTRALALSVEGGRTNDMGLLEMAREECVELAYSRAHGGPIWRALEGLRRWDESFSEGNASPGVSTAEPSGPPSVEHAALLHAVLVAASHGQACAAERRRLARAAAALCQWFQDAFWLSTPRRFADRALPRRRRQVGGEGLLDLLALRPHMVIACSLVGAPMTSAQRRDALQAAESRLMTPMGLRTLDFEAEAFDARLSSGGLIFPWLLAPYVRASALAFGLGRGQVASARSLLRALVSAPEAWYLEPGASIEAARAVGAIGLTLHGAERRSLDRLIGAEAPVGAGLSQVHGRDERLATSIPGCVDGEWVLR